MSMAMSNRSLRLARTFSRNRTKSRQCDRAYTTARTSIGGDRGGFASLGVKKGDKGEYLAVHHPNQCLGGRR